MDENREINPKRAKDLLQRLRDKEITQEDLLHECALWNMEPGPWEEMFVMQFPMPPPEWQEYERLTPLEKLKMKPEFFQQGPLREYLQAKSKVLNWNHGKYLQLKDLKKYLRHTEETVEMHERISSKTLEFFRWMQAFVPHILRRIEEPEPEPVHSVSQPEEIQSVIDTFGGTLL